MPWWGPVFKPDPQGDFVLNLSPERATFLPPGPTRRRTSPLRPRPVSLDLRAAEVDLRSPRDIAYVDGSAVTTVTRSPRPGEHRRALSSSFRQYDVSPRTPLSGASSQSPRLRSPRVVQERSPRMTPFPEFQPEPYLEIPPAEPIIIQQPQPYPVYIRDTRAETAPPTVRDLAGEDSASEDDEAPRVTVAETNRRNRREREYRETARRRRDAGRAPPERDEDDYEVVEPVRRRGSARRAPRQTNPARPSASMPPAPPAPPAAPSASSRSQRDTSSSASERRPQQSPRVTEVTRTREYHRTYEREHSRRSRDRDEPASAPPERTTQSRSTSRHVRNGSETGASRAPTIIQRSRARTDASGYLTAPPSVVGGGGPLLLEDATADKARQLVEERIIFGHGGRKSTQYHYA